MNPENDMTLRGFQVIKCSLVRMAEIRTPREIWHDVFVKIIRYDSCCDWCFRLKLEKYEMKQL